MIKGVIFDWGGVLIKQPTPEMWTHCANQLGITTDQYYETYKKWKHQLQRGDITTAQYWEKLKEDWGCPIPEDQLYTEGLLHAWQPFEKMFELVKNLKKNGYVTGFLSNCEKMCEPLFFEKHMDELFDVIVFSSSEGTRKPEKKIYEITLDRMKKHNIPAEQCVFIDNKPKNIVACEEVGMKGIVFTSPEQTIAALKEMDVKVD